MLGPHTELPLLEAAWSGYRLRSRLFDLERQRELLVGEPPIGKREILAVLGSYAADVRSTDFFRLFLFMNPRIASAEKALKELDRSGNLASRASRCPRAPGEAPPSHPAALRAAIPRA
jgi:hypothetical protein